MQHFLWEHRGFALATFAFAGASAWIEVVASATLYSGSVHTLSTGLGFAAGYPAGAWLSRRHLGAARSYLHGAGGPGATQRTDGGGSWTAGVLVACFGLSGLALLSLTTSGVLALVLVLGGIDVVTISVQWIVGSAVALAASAGVAWALMWSLRRRGVSVVVVESAEELADDIGEALRQLESTLRLRARLNLV